MDPTPPFHHNNMLSHNNNNTLTSHLNHQMVNVENVMTDTIDSASMPRTPLVTKKIHTTSSTPFTTNEMIRKPLQQMPLQVINQNIVQPPPQQQLQHPQKTTTNQSLHSPTPSNNNTTGATKQNNTPNNKRKRQFSVYAEKKRLVDQVSETTGQMETTVVSVVNNDPNHTVDDYEELKRDVNNLKIKLKNTESDVREYKSLLEAERSEKDSNQQFVFSMRAQKKHYKQGIEKLKLEVQLANNEVTRLQDSLREAEEIADQWQNKFREQQSSLQDKFAMFKTLRDQAKELEQEVKTLRVTNAELEDKWQKQQVSNEQASTNPDKNKKKVTVPAVAKARQSIAPSMMKSNQANLDLEKLKEDYDNIKISHDLLRDERRQMEDQVEKFKSSLETLQAQSNTVQEERDSLKKQLAALQSEYSNTSMMLLDSNTKLSLAEAQSFEMQKQLKDTRVQYQMEIEAIQTKDNKDQIADRYREVLILNAEYQRQIDVIQQIVSHDLKPTVATSSSVKNQVFNYQEHVSSLSNTYQSALRKARDALGEYKALCDEAEEIASEVTMENDRLSEELEESSVREMNLAQENVVLSDTVSEQQNQIDSLCQTIYLLQHHLEEQSIQLRCVREEIQLQTMQVDDMMFDEIPELEDNVVHLEIKNFTTKSLANVVSRHNSASFEDVSRLRGTIAQLEEQNNILKDRLEQSEEDMYLFYQSSKESIAYLEHRIQHLLGALAESEKRYTELLEFTKIERQVVEEAVEKEKAQTASLQFKCNQLDSKYMQSNVKREELERQNMSLQDELEQKNNLIDSLKKSISTSENELESVKSSCATLRQCISDAESNERALRSQFDDEITTAHNEIDQLRIIRASIEQEVRNCAANEKQLVEQFNKDISNAKAEIERLKEVYNKDIEQERTRSESLQSGVSQLETQLQRSTTMKEQLEKTNQTLQQTLTKLTTDYGVAQTELKDAVDEIERLTGLYYELEVELRARLNNEKLLVDKFHRDMSQFCDEKQKVDAKLRDARFECTTLKNDNKQLTLQLELILAKTQKKDWMKSEGLSDITSIELAKKEIDQLHIQVTNLTKQVSNVVEQNKLLGKELSNSRHSFATREKVMQENMKRAEMEIRCLESSLEHIEQTLVSHASEISDIPALSKLISGFGKTESQEMEDVEEQ